MCFDLIIWFALFTVSPKVNRTIKCVAVQTSENAKMKIQHGHDRLVFTENFNYLWNGEHQYGSTQAMVNFRRNDDQMHSTGTIWGGRGEGVLHMDISCNPPSHFVSVPLNVTSEMVAQFNLTNRSQPLTSAVLSCSLNNCRYCGKTKL